MRAKGRISLILLLVVVLAVVAIGYKYYQAKYNYWIPSYIKHAWSEAEDADLREGPLHIMLLMVDHFEPGGDHAYLAHWLESYRKMASRHHDSDGEPFKRTFAYPIEQFDSTEIEMLLPLCREGLGEIEMQLHHFNDNSATVAAKYLQGIADFAHYGICQTDELPPRTRFALVHGNWALDNSRNHYTPNPCGVNDEISLLAELGCYLDVTFPAVSTTAQPGRINSIYYATDDPTAPKSYDDGEPVRVGGRKSGDLMLLEGPLGLNWSDWRFGYHPTIESGDIFADYPASPERIPLWLEANVHVIGQPNWVFVKLHSHGGHKADSLAMWGPSFDSTLSHLEEHYNDGAEYLLHYVTTREAYNIVKAAEAGEQGNPNQFRDYQIPDYLANRPGGFLLPEGEPDDSTESRN